jgi:hypothetical protein
MKAVIIGEPSGVSMERILEVYPRHEAVVDAFVARGEVIGIGRPLLRPRQHGDLQDTRGCRSLLQARPFHSGGLG